MVYTLRTREIGLEVSADKTKYMVMSRDQNAGQNHRVRIDNITFERVEGFKYLGSTLTIQNSIRDEIKSRLFFGFRLGFCFCFWVLFLVLGFGFGWVLVLVLVGLV